MESIHPIHRAQLDALGRSLYAAPVFDDADSDEFVTFNSLSPSYSYSPKSSPQVTPTIATVNSFSGSSYFSDIDVDWADTMALSRGSSEGSLSDASDYSFASSSSSCSSLNSLASSCDMHLTMTARPTFMQRTSSCRYAETESTPAALKGKSVGGSGMVRSFSNPVPSLETSKARASVYALEAARALSMTPLKRPNATTDSLSRSAPSIPTASSLHVRPQSPSPSFVPMSPRTSARPGLGRFLSFDPASMATEFARSMA